MMTNAQSVDFSTAEFYLNQIKFTGRRAHLYHPRLAQISSWGEFCPWIRHS